MGSGQLGRRRALPLPPALARAPPIRRLPAPRARLRCLFALSLRRAGSLGSSGLACVKKGAGGRSNMALVPCQVLRGAILLSYFSILCNYKAIDMPAHQTYGGSWKFLTFINLVIQAVFFGICVLTDLSSLLTKGNDSQEQERQLRKLISLRDWMMAVLAFPIGVFVVTMFWSIYIYDRELVYPKLLDNFIPPWLNHGMHTTVLPFILIEMRTTHHEYPSRTCGLVAVCTFSVGYILWVCWIYHVTGVWVYPLLEYLGSGAKIIFFATVTAIINIFYLLGEILNNCIWDTQKCMEEGKEKPKLD
ncbi:androgen-induced gene 1 protein isoform X2 [Zootoca vivipara]|uniref:androgen-induced gene 1 protein isoform X2 n=1 Tax=Zootoca vivipara TaxID=8524 RepID=UPI00293BDB92|nr:androgen-induced gene 1 protein isoform X2 [Zootoca vivipara]